MAPVTTWGREAPATTLPAQIEIYLTRNTPDEYNFLSSQRAAGSANKITTRDQSQLANPQTIYACSIEKLRSRSAPPPARPICSNCYWWYRALSNTREDRQTFTATKYLDSPPNW
jgi:hypothetical protein